MKDRLLSGARLAAGCLLAGMMLQSGSGLAYHTSGEQFAYVCKFHYSPAFHNSTYGTHGNLTVQFKSQPSCGGSQRFHGYVFTRGATSSLSDNKYHYPDKALHAMQRMLQEAVFQNKQVFYVPCPGKNRCIAKIGYKAQ